MWSSIRIYSDRGNEIYREEQGVFGESEELQAK